MTNGTQRGSIPCITQTYRKQLWVLFFKIFWKHLVYLQVHTIRNNNHLYGLNIISFKLNVFSIKNWFFFSLLSVMRFLVNYSVTSLFAFIKSQNYNQPQRTFLAIDGIRRLRTGRVTRRNETSVSFSQWYSMSYK